MRNEKGALGSPFFVHGRFLLSLTSTSAEHGRSQTVSPIPRPELKTAYNFLKEACAAKGGPAGNQEANGRLR